MSSYLTLTDSNIQISNSHQEHLKTVYAAALRFWNLEEDPAGNLLNQIKVLKERGGKISAILPPHGDMPSVFIKIYFGDRHFQFESDGLRTANSIAPMEGIRAPHVIMILPEYRAFILEKRSWQDTDSELKKLFISTLPFDWNKIGNWLRAFHDAKTSWETNEYFLQHKFRKIDNHLEKLSSLFKPEEIEKMRTIISTARGYFDHNPHDWVISHGDFLIGNIKLSGQTMDVIDYEDCQMAPREFDILNFLTRLEYTGQFPHTALTFEKIKNLFLSGYGMPISLNGSVHDFLYLFIKLDVIESYFRRGIGADSSVEKRMIYRIFEHRGTRVLIKWLSNQVG